MDCYKLKTVIFLCFVSQFMMAQGFINIAGDLDINFSYQTDEYGGGVSFVDFNQDGLDDLSFATEEGVPLRFFINTGSGFNQVSDLVPDTSGVKQILWVDYNNDGLLDLYLSSQGFNKLYRNIGDLTFEDVTMSVGMDFPDLLSYTSTWFDYDADGKVDLLVAHRTKEKDGSVDLYRNVDFEHFTKVTIKAGLYNIGESVLAMTSLDYNNDSAQDIFLAQDWEKGNILLKNNGNGTFKNVSKESGIDFKMNSMTATVMDINEDGWQDIYVSNTSLGNRLFVNDRVGGFEEKAKYYNLFLSNVTFGTVFFDAENDGDNDVHVGGMLINHTFENVDDQEAFEPRNIDWGFFSDRDFNNGVAMGDIDNDGYVDIVKNSVSRGNFINSDNSLWKNQFSTHNYIKIKLEGTVSNIGGIGSRINVYTKDKVQHKRLGCGESFSSQHSLVQHFGVGKVDIIDSVIVRWPSNNISILKNVLPNQALIFKEPAFACTDVVACNYNKFAAIDDGSCRYAKDFFDCLGCLSDLDNDGVCDELEVFGCTLTNACNYDEEATEDDGSCYFLTLHDIRGPDNQEALREVEYYYSGDSGSDYKWSIENGSILAGDGSAQVTVVWYEYEMGSLKVKQIDDSGCVGATINRDIQISPAVNRLASNIWLSPNPVIDDLMVHDINSGVLTYSIYNSFGQIMKDGVLSEDDNQISFSNMTSGIYMLALKGSDDYLIERIFVQ